MARKNQKLINYHTGDKTRMPELNKVDYGEIVVRHNAESPELLIKVDENSFGVFQASGAVKSAIDSAVSTAQSTLNTKISDLQSDVNSLSSATKTLIDEVSAATKATYATKTELEATSGSIISDYTTAIGAAKDDVYSSATSFTTKEVNTLSTTISDVKSDLNELSGVVKSISTDIRNNYVTTGKLETTVTTLEGEISAAKKEATDASSAYTDTQIAAAKQYSDNKLTAATQTLTQSITNVSSSVSTLSGNVHTRIEGLKTDLTDTINKKVAVAYRYQKTVTNYADLPTSGMSEDTIGFVYNVENANGNYPAGTNYAWNGTEWDALGGSVDLSPYATKTYVDGEIKKVNQTNTDLKSDINSLSSATKTLIDEVSAATKATYATKAELKATSGSIITAYTNAIAAAKKEATDASSAYTDTQIDAAKESIKQTTDTINSNLRNLSASTVSVKTTADSAVQTASIVDKDTCKVSVNKAGTELQFNFENLVVDCGEF